MRALHLSCGGSESETRQRSARYLSGMYRISRGSRLLSRGSSAGTGVMRCDDRHVRRRRRAEPLRSSRPDPAVPVPRPLRAAATCSMSDRHVHLRRLSEPEDMTRSSVPGARDHHDRGLGNEADCPCAASLSALRVSGSRTTTNRDSWRLFAEGRARAPPDPQQRRLLHGPITYLRTAIPTRNDVVESHSRSPLREPADAAHQSDHAPGCGRKGWFSRAPSQPRLNGRRV